MDDKYLGEARVLVNKYFPAGLGETRKDGSAAPSRLRSSTPHDFGNHKAAP
jgi:hypothetical protein